VQRTKIEYLTHTWNPLAMRCTPISDGCLNCWHLAMANRLAKNPMIPMAKQVGYSGRIPYLDLEELKAPLGIKKPSRIGVQLMGDLFHDKIKPEWIDAIWEVMGACPRHTFMVLTKRPQNIEKLLYGVTEECGCRELGGGDYLPNVWLGVSCENQKTADERIPILLQIPAAKRFVSVEPMLGSVDLFPLTLIYPNPGDKHIRPLPGRINPGLDWIICGGLSLPGGKIQPPQKEWIDNLVEQCDMAGVPIFIKPNAKYHIERKDFPNGSI
jgi:protein gp37